MSNWEKLPEQSVADSVTGNAVDRLAPASWKPYLRLSRADRPVGTWLLLLPCWWSVLLASIHDSNFTAFDLWIMLGCTLGAILTRGAGCTWNDIADREFDKSVARTASRPLASGQVTVRNALIWGAVQSIAAFGILITFNLPSVILGIAALIPVLIYPFAKRFTWWPQIFLGIAFNWGALLGWMAHTGHLSAAPVLLYLGGMAWTLFYDTIYAFQDAEDDALIGVKSTARLFADKAPRMLALFIVLTVALIGGAVIIAAIDASPAALVTALCGVWFMGWHMMWQLSRFNPEDTSVLLRLFRSNRDAGLIIVLFFAVAAFV